MPSCDAARPSHCPCCHAASRPVGRPIVVVGHGLRARQQTGPEVSGGGSVDDEVPVRRYRCRECGAVIVVLPRGLLPRFRFRPVAIVLALAAWGLDGVASGTVRQALCPRPAHVMAHDSWRCWAAPGRWLRTAHRWVGVTLAGAVRSRSERVEALLQQLASRVLESTGDLLDDALAAVRVLRGHGAGSGGRHLSTS